MSNVITQDVLFFFDGRPRELAFFERLAESILACFPGARIRVKKTQIGFYDPGLFVCASFAPVRRKAERPDPYITVTFSLDRAEDHPRVLAVPIRPGLWTCHVLVGKPEDVDDVLLGWLKASHKLSDERKKDMLEVKNATKKYLRLTAVRDVSFSLEPGRICLLLGPNGSGKTTLMKMVAGLTRPTSGSIALDGVAIGASTKAKIAYMPTENYFYNYMTVRDAGRYYRDFFADFDPARFDRLLAQMELDPQSRIRQLSSGMAAKLRLSLVLSRGAELMMFDEPLNGVDILTRTQTIDAILAGRAQNRSMLISTHLVDELEDVVDSVVFLRHGERVMAGNKREICAGRTLKELYIDVYGHDSADPEHDRPEVNPHA